MGGDRLPPPAGDDGGWRAFIEPALTTALIDDVLPLFEEPELYAQELRDFFRPFRAQVPAPTS